MRKLTGDDGVEEELFVATKDFECKILEAFLERPELFFFWRNQAQREERQATPREERQAQRECRSSL